MGKKKGAEINCQHCKAMIYLPPSLLKKGRRFCSLSCRDMGRKSSNHDFEKRIKKCASCEEWKSFDDFAKVTSSGPEEKVFQAYCKACCSKKNKEWGTQNAEQRKQINKRFAINNKDRLALKAKQITREQRDKNNQRLREWRKKNADKVLLWNKIRVHRQRGAGVMPSSEDLRALFCYQDCKCVYCGIELGRGMHLDHKMPLVKGGTNEIGNLQWLCKPCNLKKATKPHELFAETVGLYAVRPSTIPAGFNSVAFVEAMEMGDYQRAIDLCREPSL